MSSSVQHSLLIDAGNTRVKWAVFQAGALGIPMKWLAQGAADHGQLADLAQQWRDLPADEVLISNVAGEALQETLQQAVGTAFPGISIKRFRSDAHIAGLQNHYRHPQQLGSDRFASAIAAHHFFPDTALVVATCGTATTVDAIIPGKGFAGGMILPGLQTMAVSLAQNTAQLPHIARELSLDSLFADNTQQAIMSGCIHAQLGAIQCAIEALEQQTAAPVELVLSGGAVPYLLPHWQQSQRTRQAHVIDNLVLTGLAVVAQDRQLPQFSADL